MFWRRSIRLFCPTCRSAIFCVLTFPPGLHVGPDVAERRLAQLLPPAGGSSVQRTGQCSSG